MPDTTVPSKPASQSKRVYSICAFLVALCTFAASLTGIPIIGHNPKVQMIAGIAVALSAFIGQFLGIIDSGTKIQIGGNK